MAILQFNRVSPSEEAVRAGLLQTVKLFLGQLSAKEKNLFVTNRQGHTIKDLAANISVAADRKAVAKIVKKKEYEAALRWKAILQRAPSQLSVGQESDGIRRTRFISL
jgi:hypothetical protein